MLFFKSLFHRRPPEPHAGDVSELNPLEFQIDPALMATLTA